MSLTVKELLHCGTAYCQIVKPQCGWLTCLRLSNQWIPVADRTGIR
jgi:hypothetical protein